MSTLIHTPAFADVVAKIRSRLAAHPIRSADEATDVNSDLAIKLAGSDYAGMLADKAAEGVAIGDDCMPCAPRSGNKSPTSCFRGGVKFCDLIRTGGRLAAANAGQTAFTIPIEPGAGADWFDPVGARMSAFDNGAFSIPRHEGMFITQIVVGRFPQEAFDAAGAAAVTAGLNMSSYVLPDWCHCPVGWAPFGRVTADKNLAINGFNLWPAATNVMAFAEVVGNSYDTQGALMACCSATGRCLPNMPAGLRARWNGNGGTGAA